MQYLSISSDRDRLVTRCGHIPSDKEYLAPIIHIHMFWEHVGNVVDARNKVKVLKALSQDRLDHRSIATLTGIDSSNARRTLRELCDSNLVRCLTPARLRVKTYEITSAGRAVLVVALRLRNNYGEAKKVLING